MSIFASAFRFKFNLKEKTNKVNGKITISKSNNWCLFFLLSLFLFSCILLVMLWWRSLGLAKIKTPPGHHRKRLAVESSRHHSRPDDSHMFIIKLPPNPYYYANQNTAQNQNGIEDKNQKVRPSSGENAIYVRPVFECAFTEISFKINIQWIRLVEWNFRNLTQTVLQTSRNTPK